MAQSITIRIADRTYSLKVSSPEHEEVIRKAAGEINKKVKLCQSANNQSETMAKSIKR